MMSLVRLLAFALVAAFSYLYLNPDARKFLAEAPASEIFQAALEVPAVASVHAALVSRGLSADRLASLAKSLPFLEKFVPASTSPGASPPRRQPCILHGEEETGACDLSNVEELNTRHVYPLLSQIVRMPFFQFFKVDLHCDCPFWPESGMCKLRDCSVCECPEEELPEPWRKEHPQAEQPPVNHVDPALCGLTEGQGTRDSSVDKSTDVLGEHVVKGSVGEDTAGKGDYATKPRGWKGTDNPWMADAKPESMYTYVNLLKNPERYTGYKGPHSRQIWSSIYGHSCLQSASTCPYNKLFYRLISGMHTSITAHICAEYLLDEHKQEWGPNYALFVERLGTTEAKEYLQNLYFTYLFVMRAAVKAAPVLTSFDFNTGLPESDVHTAALVKELLTHPSVLASCPVPFDEARMWKGEDGLKKRQELMTTFRNITQIMDCVGCEKCKLWGKLQILGMGTALKILFSCDDCMNSHATLHTRHSPPLMPLALERNEVIALLNFLGRLSSSVETVRRMTYELSMDETLAQRVVQSAGAGGIERPEQDLGSMFGLR